MRSSRWILSYKREPENRAQGARADGEALPGPERIVNMAEYKYVRCLFCTEGMENVVAGAIQASGHGRALVPRRIKKILVNKQWMETAVALLPGYVFVYSNEEKAKYQGFSGAKYILRTLTYADTQQDILEGRDREFAYWLWSLDGQIGIMKALQVGEKVEVVDGVFRQLHGTITRMDRRRKVMRVELDGNGIFKQIWLTYEIVGRLENGRIVAEEPIGLKA